MSDVSDWGLLAADRGAAFAAEINQLAADRWQASARVSLMRIRSVIDSSVGPMVFATEIAARDWLRREAAARGFGEVPIAVTRLAVTA